VDAAGPSSIASHFALLARFLAVWRRLSNPIQLTNEVVEALTIEEEGAIRVVWAPFP
jgi:hypothetical protein